MANSTLDFMKDVLAAPLGELISSVGQGVAEAQAALDAASLRQTLEIYSDNPDEAATMLRQIGYQPTFYTLPDTQVEAQVSLAISGQTAGTAPVAGLPTAPRTRMYASPINASVANKFNVDVKASAKLTFKIVPVPPPGQVSDIRVVPNLVGKTLDAAEPILSGLGLQYELAPDVDGNEPTTTGTEVIESQTPAAGELMKDGEVITLTLPEPPVGG